ncbi:cyclase family protein [Thermococcus sp. M39]|uniref:cyclase family protein n=1 Tax=unclassified Thermococcus TaxID=2627626 RepID=UPI00143A072D|nr:MULTISPECIES: cyclase family protein [unclassified Thermococcus]NJE07952.1 cyclase family protein [Thermococcus sp. M39]NJE13650.1 cyclase family protein [Thermococcus sp. LS2]
MMIDLTKTLSEELEVYAGDPGIKIKEWASLEKDGYYMNLLCFGEHSGTHVDAPAHFIKGGKTIDVLPLEKFFGKAVVIDTSDGQGEITIEEVPKTDLEGKIVLFYSGGRELSVELAEFLVNARVKAVGTDGMSIGNEEVHRTLLSAEIPIFENLTNLEKLIGKNFTFIAFPLKIKNGSGSPVRAIALL